MVSYRDLAQHLRVADLFAILLVALLLRHFINARSRLRTTKLRGPQSDNIFVGAIPKILGREDPKEFLDSALKEYGSAFSLPVGLGRRGLVICDPKGAAHILARDTYGYQQPGFAKVFSDNMVGKNNILSTERGDHRRIRKAMTPAFSNSAIRGYIGAFHENYYKLSAAWEAALDAGAETIEVQGWMNKLAIENLGLAGFSHEFKALDQGGEIPEIIRLIESFQLAAAGSLVSQILFFLSPTIPWLLNLPSENTRLLRRIKFALRDVADDLLEKTKRELETDSAGKRVVDKSIIGMLIKAEGASSGSFSMNSEEVLSQMNLLFIAGYETTSTTLTWALAELALHPEIQEKLRNELNEELHGSDASWEQLATGLPYLNAFTQEILRVHGPVDVLLREAHEDDVIPLSSPAPTASGSLVSEVAIAKGEALFIPLSYINMSEDLWGPDVQKFDPDRWMKELTPGAQTVQGYHHIMSFSDGPRFCLGRHFALANFKTTLSNMVRQYSFELPSKDTKFVRHIGLLPRPMVVGEEGPRVPLIVRRIA